MYTPPHFRQDDRELMLSFIHDHPFGIIVSANESGFPVATHIPMEVVGSDGELFLFGHIATMNPQAALISRDPQPALAVFSAGHSYVSSSWYSHPNVSTWNYRALHVTGMLQMQDDDEFRRHLVRMQDRFESGMDKPFGVSQLPDGLFEKYIKAIVGFRMKIESMHGSWKLSQNRDEKDYQSVIQNLSASDDPQAKEIAEEMRKLRKHD